MLVDDSSHEFICFNEIVGALLRALLRAIRASSSLFII